MVKHGPCCHCGVTSTPLWRNGPPEKPVLCNACGSRWRTKGTLENYTPLHARAEHDEFDNYRASKATTLSTKIFKRKHDNDIFDSSGVTRDYNQGFYKVFDKDTSNGSSSGSAVSNSEGYMQYCSAAASGLTGASQPTVWETMVPSKKRTCVTRSKPSPVEKVTKDLYAIWYEQQSSSLSRSSGEDLLLERGNPLVSDEIGHGSVLIRHPNSTAREEESEASSLSIDNIRHAVHSRQLNFPCLMEDKGVNSSSRGIEKSKTTSNLGTKQARDRRDKDQLEKLQILLHHNSPLCFIDLQDVLNFENIVNYLTNEEQQKLVKFLPPAEALGSPDNLKSMFDSPQFKESLTSFQGLLSEGLLDSSFLWSNIEDSRTIKNLIFCNLTNSWVEQYQIIKDLKIKNCVGAIEVAGGCSALTIDYPSNAKILQDQESPKLSGANSVMRTPRRITVKPVYDHNELTDDDISYFSPRGLFSSPNNFGPLALDTSCITDGSFEQDLLLDVPSNVSFPQAELLLPNSSFAVQATANSSSVCPNFVHP